MKTKLIPAAFATALMLAALPATAQTMEILLPDLTFPTDTVTGGDKGCAPAIGAVVCTLRE